MTICLLKRRFRLIPLQHARYAGAIHEWSVLYAQQLSQIQRNYVGWRIWTPDSRQLLKSDGVYNAYRGVAYDGTIVRGLVHVALVGQRVVTLSFSAPGNFNNSYQRVYNKMRNTIQ